MTTTILNIAGYRFVTLGQLPLLKNQFMPFCEAHALKGTILLSEEGINISLSGTVEAISAFKAMLNADTRFADMSFHEFYSATQPFKRLKIKLKKEIITFRQQTNALKRRAKALSPVELKKWLDENRDITLLDTRNDYEVELGTFNKAVDLHLNHFTQLPEAVRDLDPAKPVVMFCTGGIRCEKAALYMEDQGFKEVYQLDGGILGYFKTVGGDHYQGGCFVFDERVVVNP